MTTCPASRRSAGGRRRRPKPAEPEFRSGGGWFLLGRLEVGLPGPGGSVLEIRFLDPGRVRRVAGKARALARPVCDRVGAFTARQIDAVVGGGLVGPGRGTENAAAQLRVVVLRIGGRVGATQLSMDDTVAGRRSPRPLLGGLL
ncbi:MAG: hypothetical protein WBQ18_05800 [Solirubrobacteraceae bacterium]